MAAVREVNQRAVMTLRNHKRDLTRQQYKTLKGQILVGEDAAAMAGLKKILSRKT